MNGIVDQNCEATLRLVVSNESKQRQVIDAVIDTGFTGFLTLPLTVRSQSCRVRSLMQLLPLHWSILGNAPCSWIETVSLSLVGWVERNNTGAKIAQFAWKSETQPPQRLLFVGFPCVNPTYNNCWLFIPFFAWVHEQKTGFSEKPVFCALLNGFSMRFWSVDFLANNRVFVSEDTVLYFVLWLVSEFVAAEIFGGNHEQLHGSERERC